MRAPAEARWRLLPVVIMLGLGVVIPASTAQAQDDWVDPPTAYTSTTLTRGDYVWTAPVSQPQPAMLASGWDGKQDVSIPAEWATTYGFTPLVGSFSWGDGTSTTFSSDVPSDSTEIFCDNAVEYGEGGQLQPGDGFGYNCRVEAGHTYTTQGVMTIGLSVTQGEETASASSQELVIDPKTGGTLTVKGTVRARSAGMYDPNFPQPGDNTTTNVTVTARRRAGTTATTATVDISVPGMHPEFSNATGMRFRGTYALQPLYVAKTRTGGEAVLMRVEGRVTNSKGDAGGAQALIRVKVAKGSPTLIRVEVRNTSAGFAYLDTGYQPDLFLGLTSNDRLLSGSVRIG